METDTWTDEELCQVYDLQHGYEKVLLDYVRHEGEETVAKLMAVLPELYGYEDTSPYFCRSSEVTPKTAVRLNLPEDYQDWDYAYRDSCGAYKTADDLREIFEDTFQLEFGVSHPGRFWLFWETTFPWRRSITPRIPSTISATVCHWDFCGKWSVWRKNSRRIFRKRLCRRAFTVMPMS